MWDSPYALCIVATAFLYLLVNRIQQLCYRQYWNQTRIRDARRQRETDRKQKALEYTALAAETSEPAKQGFFAQRAVYWNKVATEWDDRAKQSDQQVCWWDFLR